MYRGPKLISCSPGCPAAWTGAPRAPEPLMGRSAGFPGPEAPGGAGFLEVPGDVPDEPQGDALHLRRLLEDEQSGEGLAVDVPRLEDGEHLLGQPTHLGGTPLAGVDRGQIERQQGGVVAELALDQLPVHAPQEL